VEEDVLGLEVAVDDADLVGGLEALEGLAQDDRGEAGVDAAVLG
jgi:hypothetical protein